MRWSLKKYKDFLSWVDKSHNQIDRHHIIPVSAYWPDIAENLDDLLQSDHIKLHQELDVPSRHFSRMKRKQRIRENGHIVLTPDDIEWRADIQREYLSNVNNLPWYLQEMHDIKLGELAWFEAKKFKRLTWTDYPIELWEALENHWQYIDIQKEASRHICKKLKWF